MSRDEYAHREGKRNEAYREAYRSADFKAWVKSLTPEQRVHAESLGLLAHTKLAGMFGTGAVPAQVAEACPLQHRATFPTDERMQHPAVVVIQSGVDVAQPGLTIDKPLEAAIRFRSLRRGQIFYSRLY